MKLAKNNYKFLFTVVLGLMLVAGFAGYASKDLIGNSLEVTDVENQGSIIEYHSSVCTSVIRADGTYEENDCSSNLLTSAGKELIEQILGNSGSGGPIQYIGLCNATAGCTGVAVGDTTLDAEYAAGGLSRAQGTYGSLGTGNWSIAKTFTATADNLLTNQTGLFNQSSGGTLFAENTFTLVTLQTNDQLTINWTIWVE